MENNYQSKCKICELSYVSLKAFHKIVLGFKHLNIQYSYQYAWSSTCALASGLLWNESEMDCIAL